MFTWIKRLFGYDVPDTPVIAQNPLKEDLKEVYKADKPAKKATAKTTKKKAKVALNSMKKNELLAHAKANGIKANASMNKAALIEAIKNG